MHLKRQLRDRLPLKPTVFQVLLVLIEGEQHGYSIVKTIQHRYRDGRRLLPGNLYRTLHTMREQGLIEEAPGHPAPGLDGERRRYFRVTQLGLDVARAELVRLEQLTAEAHALKLPDLQI